MYISDSDIVDQVKLIVKELQEELRKGKEDNDIEINTVLSVSHFQIKTLVDQLKCNFPSIYFLEPTLQSAGFKDLLPGIDVIEGKDKVSQRLKQYLNIFKLHCNIEYKTNIDEIFNHLFIYTNKDKTINSTALTDKLNKKLTSYKEVKSFFADTNNILEGSVVQITPYLNLKRIIKYKYDAYSNVILLDLPNGLNKIILPLASVCEIQGLSQAICVKITKYIKSKGLDENNYSKEIKAFINNLIKLFNLDLSRTKTFYTENISYSSDYYYEIKYVTTCSIKVRDNLDKNQWNKNTWVNISLATDKVEVKLNKIKFTLTLNENKEFVLENKLIEILDLYSMDLCYNKIRSLYTLTEFNKNFNEFYEQTKLRKEECLTLK